MNTPEILATSQYRRAHTPRWVAIAASFFVCLVGAPLLHGVVPHAISSLTPRYGWRQGHPGKWNLCGLIPVFAGSAFLLWTLKLHISRLPEQWVVERTPKYLLVAGPYTWTRNPMYLAEMALWIGWALFYGSSGVLIGLLVLWAVMNFMVVPFEERDLEARFGDSYLRYKQRVPRWLGKARG